MAVLMLPKLLSLIDLAHDWPRRKQFGGLLNAFGGVVGETLFSTLHAPLLMLWHTRFVLTNVAGISVGWSTQRRAAEGTDWLYASQRHWGHMLIGIVWGWFIWQLDPRLFWWFTPVWAGMVFSVPLSVLTSRRDVGARARSTGLFLTPEETRPPLELASLRSRMKIHDLTNVEAPPIRSHAGLAVAVLDPYVNAVHVTLLREKQLNPVYAEHFKRLGVGTEAARDLGEKLLAAGPEKLQPSERIVVLADEAVMAWLHRQAWLRPEEKLAPWWKAMIREFSQRD
jgi:membrane glycosyltransferase